MNLILVLQQKLLHTINGLGVARLVLPPAVANKIWAPAHIIKLKITIVSFYILSLKLSSLT